jgi:fluoride exporter
MFHNILLVGLGSAVGGVARYLVALFFVSKNSTQFPVATFTVNIVGSLGIGFLYSFLAKIPNTQQWYLLLVTGILGGFTTYSAFSLEVVNLLKNSQLLTAALYVALSIVLGLLAAYMGMVLAQKLIA